MTNQISPGCLAYIIAPAFELAVGRVVQVVRLATGDSDLDGVEFYRGETTGAVWVVRGHQIPWGDTFVNVLAIEGICLRKLSDPEGDPVEPAQTTEELAPTSI